MKINFNLFFTIILMIIFVALTCFVKINWDYWWGISFILGVICILIAILIPED